MLPAIKKHYGNCSIEVHTTTLYQSAFYRNPYVNRVVAHPANTKQQCFNLYNTVPIHVRKQRYDKVFVPAPILHPTKRNSLKHPEFGENLICTFMRVLEDNGIEYDWPVTTTLKLTKEEIQNVDNWLKKHSVTLDNHRSIIMEIHGESGQTFWNHAWTLAAGRYLLRDPYTQLFISRKDKTHDIDQLEKEFSVGKKRVFWTGPLSIRECAELYNRCQIFFSISSGLSNACCTDHCRTDKRWVETVNSPTVTSAPLRSEGKIFWYDNNINNFIKMLKDNDF